MILQTRDFGEIEIDEQDIITFTGPIFGFEQYSKFAFLYQEDVSEHFVWLQSVEEPELCFILVEPEVVTDRYEPKLPREAEDILGDGQYMCWLMASIREPFQKSTVNMKSPIVVNPELHKAAQIILDGDMSPRHPLIRGEDS